MTTLVGKQNDVARLLNALIELDRDAALAYEAAIDRLDDEGDKVQLTAFREDHQRHVRELETLLAEPGRPAPPKHGVKGMLAKGKVVLAAIVGDRSILLAMKSNEDDANAAYDRAMSREDVPAHVREVLLRNRDDERRHRAYIEQRLADLASGREVQESARIGGEPARRSR